MNFWHLSSCGLKKNNLIRCVPPLKWTSWVFMQQFELSHHAQRSTALVAYIDDCVVTQFPALIIAVTWHRALDAVTVMSCHVQRGYNTGWFARVPNYPGGWRMQSDDWTTAKGGQWTVHMCRGKWDRSCEVYSKNRHQRYSCDLIAQKLYSDEGSEKQSNACQSTPAK